jgi:Flp pilus assembly protein TadD
LKLKKLVCAHVVFAAVLSAGSLFIVSGAGRSSGKDRSTAPSTPAAINIDYPLDGSVFPPEITSPTILWHDVTDTAKRWVVEVSFADRTGAIRVQVAGDHLTMGEIDSQAGTGDDLLHLTAEQEATRTWKPDADIWAKIKQHSVKVPATITITGFADDELKLPVSAGTVSISTSVDRVGAPVFYRDVPLLLPPPEAKGGIQPLPAFAIPLIKWRLRNIGENQSRVVMENLPTCANCHSFSNDGKTLGLDMDGPKNDKGLYALVPVSKNTTIRNQDVIRWSSFLESGDGKSSDPAVKRFGFMSQISPNGQYVITSIGPPGLGNAHQKELPEFVAGLADRLFSMNYTYVPFAQVFYPTRGILAWYDRKEQKLRPLPGADDPHFVHTSAFWSPDGKYLIFSRAEARDTYPLGSKKPEYANDPNETQIQYDLYRIPFNAGKGGKAEAVIGASANGMSNNFPKVSPDGRWIVFVQNHNGLLMRPDSKLYIVPFEGGKARLMKCNTSLMNSWHTFSPNGRWLAFSSKARSSYTQLMLTHIDAQGNDTPAILVENTTAANRAVNIPEFVNIPQDGIDKIDPQATEFYRLYNHAVDLIESKHWTEAIPVLRSALQHEDDSLIHYILATALTATDQERDAVEEYRKACAGDGRHAVWFDHFAVSLANTGDLDGAVVNWRKALSLNPADAGAESDLGTTLFEKGQTQEGYEHLRKAIELAPNFPDAHNRLGLELVKTGRLDEAESELQKAVALSPESEEYRINLGYVMASRENYAGAVTNLQKAVELSDAKDWKPLDMLAHAYSKVGRFAEAEESEKKALELVAGQLDQELEKNMRENLKQYEQQGGKTQGW